MRKKDIPSWIKVGASFRVHGRRYHIRGIVDGQFVLREWWPGKQRWNYSVECYWWFYFRLDDLRRGKIKDDERKYKDQWGD